MTQGRSFGKAAQDYDKARPTYPADAVAWAIPEGATAVADDIAKAAKAALIDWVAEVGKGITKNKLDSLEIEFFCLPLPSAQGFRDTFLEVMGLKP